jgi:hypothetical protein
VGIKGIYLWDVLEPIPHLREPRQDVGFIAFATQLEKDGKLSARRTDVADGLRPIDIPLKRQKVLILFAMVVVNVDGGDPLMKRAEGGLNATRHMRVARIKTDFQIQARVVQERLKVLGGA